MIQDKLEKIGHCDLFVYLSCRCETFISLYRFYMCNQKIIDDVVSKVYDLNFSGIFDGLVYQPKIKEDEKRKEMYKYVI